MAISWKTRADIYLVPAPGDLHSFWNEALGARCREYDVLAGRKDRFKPHWHARFTLGKRSHDTEVSRLNGVIGDTRDGAEIDPAAFKRFKVLRVSSADHDGACDNWDQMMDGHGDLLWRAKYCRVRHQHR